MDDRTVAKPEQPASYGVAPSPSPLAMPERPTVPGLPGATAGSEATVPGLPSGFGPSGRAGPPPVQRVRISFAKLPAIRYIGHLDVVRLFERAFRRARLPLAYTLGFTPHPRLVFAAPLALGATGSSELLDVYLTRRLALDELRDQLAAQLPPGCRLVALQEMPLDAPSVATLVRWAEYLVEVVGASAEAEGLERAGEAHGSRWARRFGDGGEPATFTEEEIAALGGAPWRPPAEQLPPLPLDPPAPDEAALRERIAAFLAAASWPRTRRRDDREVAYDLRPLVLDLWLVGGGAAAREPGSAAAATSEPGAARAVQSPSRDAPGRQPAEPARVAGRAWLGMILRAGSGGEAHEGGESGGAGRPEEVAAALGLRATRIHRVRLGLAGEPPSRSC